MASFASPTAAPMPKNSCVTPSYVFMSTSTPASLSFLPSISPSAWSGSISASTMVVGGRPVSFALTRSRRVSFASAAVRSVFSKNQPIMSLLSGFAFDHSRYDCVSMLVDATG